MARGGLGSRAAWEAKHRRDLFIAALTKGMSLDEAIVAAQWSTAGYRHARTRWSDFRAEADLLLGRRVEALNRESEQGFRWNPSDGFAAFRRQFLGNDSPWFHLQAINEMESMPPGSIVLLLWPPEHGKTALWEDYDTYLVATNPSIRITVGSEKRDQAGKVVGFVRERLEHDADGMAMLRERFGPFAPPRGAGRGYSSQRWGTFAFDVAKRPRGEQRDPTMQAIGMGSSIIGTRCDVLQVDDPQSRKSIGRTDELIEVFRQDWLSRPGPLGRTGILMNRVGEDDFPQGLLEKTDIIDKVITVPAWHPERGWAWPERYSDQNYRTMRKNAGEDAWERNYMQRGLASRLQRFNDDILGHGKNPLRSIIHPPPRHPLGGGAQVVLSMDPGFGITAVHAGAVEPSKFRSLDFGRHFDLESYADFGRLLERYLREFTLPDVCRVHWVVIETKAFQEGLVRDERILELQDEYGFELQPFTTSGEKNDEDLGIPQIARSITRGELDFPDMDEVSREKYDELYRELKKWRPHVRGNKLRQDLVMALYFGWNLWKRVRRTIGSDESNWDFGGIGRHRAS